MYEPLWKIAEPRTVFLAKAAWKTRQAGYEIVKIQQPETPLLKDWDDCPDDTKDWMCSEALAMLNALKHWYRLHPDEAA